MGEFMLIIGEIFNWFFFKMKIFICIKWGWFNMGIRIVMYWVICFFVVEMLVDLIFWFCIWYLFVFDLFFIVGR